LFHAGAPGFTGGFVGVDVFFVISGYLITSIIRQDLERGTFSLANFWERRARRILPALYFVMFCCIPFAWAWMLPDDLQNFGQSLVATVLFSNNLLLALTTGYWGILTDFRPLFHTWTLAVEEQYYVLFPLVVLGLLRMGGPYRSGCGLGRPGRGSASSPLGALKPAMSKGW
jgi:peptidoglycan/LPS O-acetylase OafA/YrhL